MPDYPELELPPRPPGVLTSELFVEYAKPKYHLDEVEKSKRLSYLISYLRDNVPGSVTEWQGGQFKSEFVISPEAIKLIAYSVNLTEFRQKVATFRLANHMPDGGQPWNRNEFSGDQYISVRKVFKSVFTRMEENIDKYDS